MDKNQQGLSPYLIFADKKVMGDSSMLCFLKTWWERKTAFLNREAMDRGLMPLFLFAYSTHRKNLLVSTSSELQS